MVLNEIHVSIKRNCGKDINKYILIYINKYGNIMTVIESWPGWFSFQFRKIFFNWIIIKGGYFNAIFVKNSIILWSAWSLVNFVSSGFIIMFAPLWRNALPCNHKVISALKLLWGHWILLGTSHKPFTLFTWLCD